MAISYLIIFRSTLSRRSDQKNGKDCFSRMTIELIICCPYAKILTSMQLAKHCSGGQFMLGF